MILSILSLKLENFIRLIRLDNVIVINGATFDIDTEINGFVKRLKDVYKHDGIWQSELSGLGKILQELSNRYAGAKDKQKAKAYIEKWISLAEQNKGKPIPDKTSNPFDDPKLLYKRNSLSNDQILYYCGKIMQYLIDHKNAQPVLLDIIVYLLSDIVIIGSDLETKHLGKFYDDDIFGFIENNFVTFLNNNNIKKFDQTTWNQRKSILDLLSKIIEERKNNSLPEIKEDINKLLERIDNAIYDDKDLLSEKIKNIENEIKILDKITELEQRNTVLSSYPEQKEIQTNITNLIKRIIEGDDPFQGKPFNLDNIGDFFNTKISNPIQKLEADKKVREVHISKLEEIKSDLADLQDDKAGGSNDNSQDGDSQDDFDQEVAKIINNVEEQIETLNNCSKDIDQEIMQKIESLESMQVDLTWIKVMLEEVEKLEKGDDEEDKKKILSEEFTEEIEQLKKDIKEFLNKNDEDEDEKYAFQTQIQDRITKLKEKIKQESQNPNPVTPVDQKQDQEEGDDDTISQKAGNNNGTGGAKTGDSVKGDDDVETKDASEDDESTDTSQIDQTGGNNDGTGGAQTGNTPGTKTGESSPSGGGKKDPDKWEPDCLKRLNDLKDKNDVTKDADKAKRQTEIAALKADIEKNPIDPSQRKSIEDRIKALEDQINALNQKIPQEQAKTPDQLTLQDKLNKLEVLNNQTYNITEWH